MKLLIFGATGPTGLHLVQQALSRGDVVTAFVRKPEALKPVEGRVRIVTGDVTEDRSRIIEATEGQDAVLTALGRRQSFKSEALMTRSMRLIVPAMEQARVRRLVVMSAFGVGDSYHDAPLVPRLMYRVLLRDIFADKQRAEEYVRASRTEWTIVYPVLLTNGALTARYRAGERLVLSAFPQISRADVAHFMLSELERREYVRKTVVVSY